MRVHNPSVTDTLKLLFEVVICLCYGSKIEIRL